jgi:GH24 family phage-related lysozyme (muramidase)
MDITVTALTPRIAAYCCRVEGIVLEAYKDNATPRVWTWAGGISTKSGFDVLQFKDKPQSLEVCLRATVNLMLAQYYPVVLRTFAELDLTEIQLAAALSFEWHYGAIARADWVRLWLKGRCAESRQAFENWTDRGKAVERSEIEQAMFFDGIWPKDLRAPVYSVAKPSYTPIRPKLTDVLPLLNKIITGTS